MYYRGPLRAVCLKEDKMKKAVDVNKRTLEMEKENFIKACKIFQSCSLVLKIFCAVLIAGLFALVILALVNGKEQKTALALFVGGFIFLGTIIVSMNFISDIAKKLKDGETPFRYDIGDKIKGAGLSLCSGGFYGFLATPFTSAYDIGLFTVTFFVGYCGFCIVGAVVIMFAYIFNYGCKLQQEADETV